MEALTSIFAEGSIPQEYLDRAFNDTDQYGATIIQKGVVRYVYEKSKSLTPDETLQVSDSLKMCLETYHRLVSQNY